MSKSNNPRIAEYRQYPNNTKHECEYTFRKREWGGWLIYVNDFNIGWVTKGERGWTLWHSPAGEIKGTRYGVWANRDEAAKELIRSLASDHIWSPAARTQIIDRDAVNMNDFIRSASRQVQKWGWEIEYETWKAQYEGATK
jgi:hypothetical protein